MKNNLIRLCLAAGTLLVCWHNRLAAEESQKDNPTASLQPAAVGSDEHVWLSVKGKQIVTSALSEGGVKPFIPVGIGYCRDVILRAQDEAVAQFCKEHSLNTIRLSFYTRFFNNRADRPINIEEHLQNFCDPVVAAARKYGLYVILDDHGYFSGAVDENRARQEQKENRWDDAGFEDWIARWVKVAQHYKNDPYVLGYELCNEPHDIPAEVARKWYTRALEEIRKVDTRHIVILGNNNWSHARAMDATWGATAATLDEPFKQVVFSFHDYPLDNNPPIVQKNITEFRDRYNVPVLCTEFGATWWDHPESVCREFQAGMLDLFAKERVGWMIWALSGVRDNPGNPHPPTNKEQKKIEAETGKKFVRDPKEMYDSCAYSDLWTPVAKTMGSPFPTPAR